MDGSYATNVLIAVVLKCFKLTAPNSVFGCFEKGRGGNAGGENNNHLWKKSLSEMALFKNPVDQCTAGAEGCWET